MSAGTAGTPCGVVCTGGGCCGTDVTRAAAYANRAQRNAIDYVEVSEDQLTVYVYFMGAVPAVAGGSEPDGLRSANVRVTGGDAVTGIVVTGLAVLESDDGAAPGDDSEDDPAGTALAVTVDRRGDFSSYTLSLGVPGQDGGWAALPGFDPAFSAACFSFKAACPTGIDCVQPCDAPAPAPPDPSIDYLAKDYESFRTLLLDRLATTMPGWQERHAADVGIALVEAMAYAADELSYYQDAVGTEAYLRTARRRISVRRHVRLVDYYLHEGLNARAWLTVWTDRDTPPVDAADVYFITGFPELSASLGTVLTDHLLAQLPTGGYTVFEPVDPAATVLVFRAAHSEIALDTGGEPECALPRGSTRATLVDKALWRQANPESELPARWGTDIPVQPLVLAVGDVLVLEEVRGPATGDSADADPRHRQAVRLTAVTPPADGGWLVDVAWDSADALTFTLCLSTRTPAPGCLPVEGISVARGNVLLVDHGQRVADPPWDPVPTLTVAGECSCEDAAVEETRTAAALTPTLARGPLTHTEAVLPGASACPAADFLVRDPRQALPVVELSFTDPATGVATLWEPRRTLLDSGPLDRVFVAEIDDDGRARLRFGDGALGKQPAAGLVGTARYRVGNGTVGKVGRDSIAFMVLRNAAWSGANVRPRNPLPAAGGLDPETVAEARLLAPDEFRRSLLRAITADDYATLAGTQPGLQRAAAQLAWTGSWYEARVGIDPWGSEQPAAQLLAATRTGLAPYRRMGHDLAVTVADYVPVDVELSVCVLAHYVRGDVRGRLLRVLGSGTAGSGTLGFFHPDRLTFGGGVYVSALVAAAQAVPGVESVVVTRLQRQGQDPNQELENGVLTVGPLEIVRLDNSPDFPDHGRLTLTLGGGL
ncbi:putative baseplate assembly protein [Arthrobacter livingstonensis]|uniref:Putative baseplate assembly protein n=1 Tax=Arthrobacter livingstonensis TaxID=670078 RepID=A0A2V5L503_9MICC|nr:putative baseplate assembly protein [Arthrobacter livingstonensis]PYI66571.1 putative baseplate assembly protein [Arthrobacter livingstonensis]